MRKLFILSILLFLNFRKLPYFFKYAMLAHADNYMYI